MKIYRKGLKKQSEISGHFTFPDNQAELSEETVKGLRLEAALKRFGRQLLEQCGKKVIGVELSGVSFHCILAPADTP